MATGVHKSAWAEASRDRLRERAGGDLSVRLEYEGKRAESEILATAPATTKPLWRSAGGENRLYFGDNLAVLSALRGDATVRGQVRLVYIDPPFATRSVFKSRSQADAYGDLLVGAHFLEFLRERLILLRELLADDGSIYVHLDEHMAFHARVLMDEVFGAANFRNWITRKKCNPKNYTKRRYGNVADYLLFYSKSDEYLWNRPVDAWTDARATREYPCIEEGTGRRYKKVPVHAPGERNGETGKAWRGVAPPPGKHWQFTPKTLDAMDARGEIYWSPTGNPRRKIFLDASAGVAVQDIWTDFRDAHNQNIEVTGYPTEKNPALLERIVGASSKPGDLVLDAFSGSGTTLAVASAMNRRWIGVDNSPEALAVTLQRFAKGTLRMGDFVRRLSPETPPSTARLDAASPVVRDFSLHAAMPYEGALDEALASWRDLHPETRP
jgi:adenine-specific DNA-methyltransferase